MKMDVQYFNSVEAAKILGVNVSTIKRWTDEGKLACIRTAGGHRKFLMNHLSDFLEKNKKKTSRVNLFPMESKTDLRISYYIMKGDFDYLIQHLKKQALLGKRELIQHVLNGLYLGQYQLHSIYDRLVTPVLHEIGELWEQNNITVIEEHLASQTIRDCVIRLQGIIRIPARKTATVLCLNLAGELHDIALKMVDHILEARGYKVLFSGQITPMLSPERLFDKTRPERVYISSTIVTQPEEVQREFDTICQVCETYNSKIFLGGAGFDIINFDHPVVDRRLYTFEEVYMS